MKNRMKFCAEIIWFVLVIRLSSCQENVTNTAINLNTCSTMSYRSLSNSMQNEHQCLLLQKISTDLEDERQYRESMISDIVTQLDAVNEKLNTLNVHMTKSQTVNDAEAILSYSPMFPSIPMIRECNELNINGIHVSGVYPVKLPNHKILNVYCDMETERGGWTLIQRRMDGSVNFTRGWNDYAFGFGNVNSEYWLGNEYLHELTVSNNFTLRIDLWDWEGDQAYAEYKYFFVNNEADGYRMHVSEYRGTAGDSLTGYHNDMKFSTIDKDNDLWFSSCAMKDESGWWYRDCGYSTLNGIYRHNGTIQVAPDGLIKGIIWYHWKYRYGYSLKRVEMKIKPTLAITIERELLENLQRQSNRRNYVATTAQPEDENIRQNSTSQLQSDNRRPSTTPAPQRNNRRQRNRIGRRRNNQN